ncbi:MAG: hypothetical protein J5714_03665 [Alphaproteobacteria bacterium]|nr:hypothetical protein [Alphaproteobacteria bacterium]
MEKLGGNIAVRSSADIEDQKGKTYSGQFESVLNVKTRDQVAGALNTVYASAANVPNAKMGVILQSMVPTPQMAGVVYSETFFGAPFIVMHYVKNDFADRLLSDENFSDFHRFATGKALTDKNHGITRFNLSNINNSEYNMVFYPNAHTVSPQRVSAQDRETYRNHFLISALCSELEPNLGYPVDMEFVVSKDNKINIVQQRPYCLPEFYEIQIDEHTKSAFSLDKPIIEGHVGFINSIRAVPTQEYSDINIWKSDESVHVFTKDSVGVKFKFEFDCLNSPFEGLYGHHGNMRRENLDFTVLETWGRSAEFEKIKPNDYVRINMLTGKFNIIAKTH